jgi:hypothetical protein
VAVAGGIDNTSRGMSGARAFTAVLAVLAGALGAPAGASAETYTVHSCLGAGMDGWTRSATAGGVFAVNQCPAGGAWQLGLRGNVNRTWADYAMATFTAPADTTVFAYTVWRSARVARTATSDYMYGHDYGDFSQRREECVTTCTGIGDPAGPYTQQNEVWGFGLRVRQLRFMIGCERAPNCAPVTSDPARLWIHNADIHLDDPYPPEFLGTPRGSLVDSREPLTGVREVAITAMDRGSGVREAIAEVDGHEIARSVLDANGGACQPPFRHPVPCKLNADGVLAVDTSRVPDGAHLLRLKLFDATGKNVQQWGPVPIATANGCLAEGRSRSVRMRAGVAAGTRRRARATVGYGRRPTVSGTLTSATGAPVAGAGVCVITRSLAPGARRRLHPGLVTDARGRFSYRLGRGPSRSVKVVHAAADGAATRTVRLRVRASVRLRSTRRRLRNGQALWLVGRVRGGPVPENGAVVELQAKRETGWQTFGTARARRGGRFRFRYQFSRTTGVQHYRLRARVPSQSGYPYAPGASRPVRVTVRG